MDCTFLEFILRQLLSPTWMKQLFPCFATKSATADETQNQEQEQYACSVQYAYSETETQISNEDINAITGAVTNLIPETTSKPGPDVTKDTPSRPSERVTFATEVEEIPPKSSKLSRFVERLNNFLVKTCCFFREEDDNETAFVVVTVDGHQVDMVIDNGCFESVISHDQWKKLGEPELKRLTVKEWMTFKREGKYKDHVNWVEMGGFYNATVKLQDYVTIVPIYVCKKDKVIPNFLGRRLSYGLDLPGKNAALIEITRKNETKYPPTDFTNNKDE